MSLAREPLVHFLVAGVVLFAGYAWFNGQDPAADADTIVVDRRALLTFLQYRANAFDPETFGAALDAMSQQELGELVDAYIDEEIMYREAQALGLDQSDNIIRQRMVQKMNFLIADITQLDSPADADALRRYFEANVDAYAIQPWVTFTHVFFDADRRGADGARAAAEAALSELNAGPVPFNDAPQYGDGFPFLRNYVERTLEFVAGHFGYEFVGRIETLEPSSARWQGPFGSAYGQHLILLTERTERSLPNFEDVAADVERDLAVERSNAALVDLTREMRQRYEIRIDTIRNETPE